LSDSSRPRRRSKTQARAHVSPEAAAPDPIEAASLDEAFVKALEADFIAHGKSAIAAMRADKPADYVKIVAALRTKDAGGAAGPLREMSDAELDRHIEELARRAGYDIRVVAAGLEREGAAAAKDADAD